MIDLLVIDWWLIGLFHSSGFAAAFTLFLRKIVDFKSNIFLLSLVILKVCEFLGAVEFWPTGSSWTLRGAEQLSFRGRFHNAEDICSLYPNIYTLSKNSSHTVGNSFYTQPEGAGWWAELVKEVLALLIVSTPSPRKKFKRILKIGDHILQCWLRVRLTSRPHPWLNLTTKKVLVSLDFKPCMCGECCERESMRLHSNPA